MNKPATEIIIEHLTTDRNLSFELAQLWASCSSLESKAAAAEHLFEGSLSRSLRGSLQYEVTPSLLAKTSWLEVAMKLDQVFNPTDIPPLQ